MSCACDDTSVCPYLARCSLPPQPEDALRRDIDSVACEAARKYRSVMSPLWARAAIVEALGIDAGLFDDWPPPDFP